MATDAAFSIGRQEGWCLGGLLLARRESKSRFCAIRGGAVTADLTADELYDAAARVAGALVLDHSLARGAEVVLALPDPVEFAIAFFGVSLAGGVPVPGPDRAKVHPTHRRRLESILRTSVANLIVVPDVDDSPVTHTAAAVGVPAVTLAELRSSRARPPLPAEGPTDEAPAYVQYTSGSLSTPKPVVVSNANVRAQLIQAATAYGEDADCVCVNWVPLHHDMGLVTSLFRPLWSGYLSVLLDATEFVRYPRLWVQAMSDWGATHTSAPDFGYALCAQRTDDINDLDLSRLRVARSAGEMVRQSTMRDFAARFAPAGFRPSSFKPSYGLAEATLTVTSCPLDRGPTTLAVSRSALLNDEIAEAVGHGDEQVLVSCGPPLPGTVVRIVSDAGQPLTAPRQVGRVWISGPQVAGQEVLADGSGERGHLTSDLGFIADDELVLLGRAQDRFQVRAENFYSHEIEAVIAAKEPRVRPGRVAVFVDQPDSSAETRVIVLAESARALGRLTAEARAELQQSLRRLVRREFGLTVAVVEVLAAGALAVTTSGKLARGQCRERYLSGAIYDSGKG